MVETGQLPSCPRIEMRRPCISSSQTLSTVPALPSVRITALPTSSVWARVNSPRIVHARSHDGVPQIRRIVRRWLVFERRGSRDERAAKICRWNCVPRDLEIVGGAELPLMPAGSLAKRSPHTSPNFHLPRPTVLWLRSECVCRHALPQSPWGDRQQVGGSGVAPKAPSAGAAPKLGISARSARCPSHEDGAPSVRRQRE